MKSEFEPTTVQQPDGARQPALVTLAERAARVVRQLEPGVATLLAAGTGFLAATSPAVMPQLWIYCLLALGVAAWATVRRPGWSAEPVARALVLLAAAYLLHTDAAASGGVAGVFAFWLAIPALYYAFSLRTPLACLVAVAAVAEFTLAALWLGHDTLSSLAARGAFLLILPMLLAMQLGVMLRRCAERVESARRDSSTGLYNRVGIMMHGNILLASCRKHRRELTLAVFDCNDLVEARTVYGKRVSRKLIAGIVRKLTLLAADQGVAARTGPTQFAVALPMSRDKAVHAIERLLGNPCRFELEGGEGEVVLVPNLMVESIAGAGTLERLFAAMCRGLARIQEEEARRQRYLQRERERHSRPMPLQAPEPDARALRMARVRLDPDPVAVQRIPNTIPMPLPTR
jgi:GGDEF domain-containing protein